MFGDIRINVVVAAVVCIAALIYLVVVRKPREVLPAEAEAPAEDADEPDAVVLTKPGNADEDPSDGP